MFTLSSVRTIFQSHQAVDARVDRAKRREGYEAATVRNILTQAEDCTIRHRRWRADCVNPAARFAKKNRGGQKTKINPLTKEEASVFLQRFCNSNRKNVLFVFALCQPECGAAN
jgi:hypothetical protein